MRERLLGFALIAALYFTQGIPLGLAMEALPTLLRRQQVPLDILAFLPLVGLPWVLKFLWAPVVDNVWCRRLGRRRSWILPMQTVVLLCLLATAFLEPAAAAAGAMVTLFALASLASSTQDTATDGLAAERFSGRDLARANGIQVAGTMVGFFFGGSGYLVLAGWFGTGAASLMVAAVVAAGLVLALLWREPPASEPDTSRAKASLRRFLTQPGALSLLGLALLSAVTASAGFGLWKLFLLDRGWTLERIGALGMGSGAVTILLGCGGGVWLVMRAGAWRTLFLGLGASLAGAACWAAQAAGLAGAEGWAAVAAGLGSFGTGATSVATMALAMRFAARSGQAGTDMTAVQSVRDLGEIGTSGTLTALAAGLGYGGAFVTVAVVAMVAMSAVAMARRIDHLRVAARELRA